jgi:hypothetical protein
MAKLSANEQIEKIRNDAAAEIERLKATALAELEEKRAEALAALKTIDDEIAELTGKPAGGTRKTRKGSGPKSAGLKPDLQELKAMLAKADGKTLSIRKAGLDTENVKTLAAANPGLLKMGAKGPWPTVTLTK